VKPPNFDRAVVPEAKIVKYLLSPTHPTGRGKAIFFMRFGFTLDQWKELADALLRHVVDHEVAKTENTLFGARYVVEGTLQTPDERNPRVRSVWFVERDSDIPQFVTAYKLED